eukprot:TRINITY_DN34081_c0_g1_i1.p3 TRINITY_DN34081_c0_g1~~TRINITY_DN34081_c0_g1_i1.p3  ORF type:complete len:455 (+),score=90.47 TRINITY_DN34081_c0_g1_i1:94-1458(+)
MGDGSGRQVADLGAVLRLSRALTLESSNGAARRVLPPGTGCTVVATPLRVRMDDGGFVTTGIADVHPPGGWERHTGLPLEVGARVVAARELAVDSGRKVPAGAGGTVVEVLVKVEFLNGAGEGTVVLGALAPRRAPRSRRPPEDIEEGPGGAVPLVDPFTKCRIGRAVRGADCPPTCAFDRDTFVAVYRSQLGRLAGDKPPPEQQFDAASGRVRCPLQLCDRWVHPNLLVEDAWLQGVLADPAAGELAAVCRAPGGAWVPAGAVAARRQRAAKASQRCVSSPPPNTGDESLGSCTLPLGSRARAGRRLQNASGRGPFIAAGSVGRITALLPTVRVDGGVLFTADAGDVRPVGGAQRAEVDVDADDSAPPCAPEEAIAAGGVRRGDRVVLCRAVSFESGRTAPRGAPGTVVAIKGLFRRDSDGAVVEVTDADCESAEEPPAKRTHPAEPPPAVQL